MALPLRHFAPYNQGMRHERETMPPTAGEAESVREFEAEVKRDGTDYYAHGRVVLRAIRRGRVVK